MADFTCSCCNSFKSLTLRTSLNHYFIVHRNEPNFQLTCNVDGCPATFKKYNSFYKHVHKQHRAIYDQQPAKDSWTGKMTIIETITTLVVLDPLYTAISTRQISPRDAAWTPRGFDGINFSPGRFKAFFPPRAGSTRDDVITFKNDVAGSTRDDVITFKNDVITK